MNLQTFDLNLLRVLDALLKDHSTVKAGERIGLSQPAVSAALSRLRHALNDALFVRHGQKIVPTSYASSLELPLRLILDDIEGLLAGPETFEPASMKASFRISGSDFFAEMLMPQLAQVLARTAPKVVAQLVDLVPENHLKKLENHLIDMALIPGADFPGWVEHEIAFKSEFVMISRKGHEELARAGVKPGGIVPMDLFCDLGHVVFSQEGNLKAMGDAALARMGRERRVVMTLPVFGGVASAVAQSNLVGLMPDQIARKYATRLGLEIYGTPMALGPAIIRMAWHRRNSGNAAHKWFRETVMNVLHELDRSQTDIAIP